MKKSVATLLYAGYVQVGGDFTDVESKNKMMDAGIARLAELQKEHGLYWLEGRSVNEMLIHDAWRCSDTERNTLDDELFAEWKVREGIKNLMRNLP